VHLPADAAIAPQQSWTSRSRPADLPQQWWTLTAAMVVIYRSDTEQPLENGG